jgi:hypothetical protein
MSAGALAMTASLLAAVPAAAGGVTVTVPGDYATIQEAVDAAQNDLDPGEVIVESDGVFDEPVLIQEGVTLRAGDGFSPTIEQDATLVGPLRILATGGLDTTVAVVGLTLRLTDGFSVVSIANSDAAGDLEVLLERVTIEGLRVGEGVAADSGDGDVSLSIEESTVEVVGLPIVGGGEGSSCLRLAPLGFDLSAVLFHNHFRFSRASGVRLRGGGKNDFLGFFAIANVFEGFVSDGFGGFGGVRLAGSDDPDVDLSFADAELLSNLLVRTDIAIDAFSILEHQIDLTANNNTIVDSSSDSILLVARDDSAMTASLSNNVIVGPQLSGIEGGDPDGRGIAAEVSDQAVIDLYNDHNLLFDNFGGDYGGIAMPGPNDVFADPLFVDRGQGNYRLGPGSPAIDAGDNEPPGGNEDFDLDLGPRVVDGDLDGTETVDIGAYERSAPSVIEVPALSLPALLAFAGLLAAAAAWRLRRRPVRASPPSGAG